MNEGIRGSLDRERLTRTIQRLELRIAERFPEAGLLESCQELLHVAQNIREDLAYISRPNWWTRGSVLAFILLASGFIIIGASSSHVPNQQLNVYEFIQYGESAINDVVLIGAALVFLFSIELRVKRRRVTQAVNRLRAIAHVIDMHQLTKDPSILLLGGEATTHSPKRTMRPAALGRYLDYCSEMLSLTSKVGFCYVQDFDDAAAVRAVNELENLTNGLSRKVGQKIMLLRHEASGPLV